MKLVHRSPVAVRGGDIGISPGAPMHYPINSGPVLIFNDDVSALELTALSLKNSGFSTLTCTSIASALERLQSVGGDVETLITDVTLSDSSGIEIASNLHARTPGMNFLFVSEHSFEDWTETAAVLFNRLPADSVRFLRKPYSAHDLVVKLIELSRDPRHGIASV